MNAPTAPTPPTPAAPVAVSAAPAAPAVATSHTGNHPHHAGVGHQGGDHKSPVVTAGGDVVHAPVHVHAPDHSPAAAAHGGHVVVNNHPPAHTVASSVLATPAVTMQSPVPTTPAHTVTSHPVALGADKAHVVQQHTTVPVTVQCATPAVPHMQQPIIAAAGVTQSPSGALHGTPEHTMTPCQVCPSKAPVVETPRAH